MRAQHWVWVTRPEFYRTDDAAERSDLDPARGYTPEGWWTCHPDTREGDLAVLYRSQERKDIGYLIAVRSDAEVLQDQDSEFDGWHVCRYQVLARFPEPITIAAMREDDVLSTWPALRADFVQRAFPVPDPVWERLFERLGLSPTELQSTLVTGERRFRYERDLEKWLIDRGDHAFDAADWTMSFDRSQYPCGTGRADLVYQQGRGLLRRRVVVELKRDTVGCSAVQQVRRYREFLDGERRSPLRRTVAILVGERLDPVAQSAVDADRHLHFVPISQLQAVDSEL